MATTENSTLYKVICFIVVWIDTIARNYLRIKAIYDAVVQVARASPSTSYQAPTSSLRSYHHHQPQRRQRQRPCYINQLPTEIIQVILEMTGTYDGWFHCTRVCQRWHRLVTPLLWKAPILPSLLPPNDRQVIQRFVRSLPKYGFAIQSLRLNGWVTDLTMRAIMHHCPHLKSLALEKVQGLTEVGFQTLARARCTPQLTHLTITNAPALTDDTLVALSLRCRSLEWIELIGCRRISRTGLSPLIAASPPHTLNLNDCIRLSGHILHDIAQYCGEHLVRLHVARIGTVLHSDLAGLVRRCSRLKVLDVARHRSALICQLQYRVRMEEERPIQRILARSKSSLPVYTKSASTTGALMERLRLCDQRSQNDVSTPLVLEHCSNGDQVSPATLEMILDRLTRLESLDASHWPYVTDPIRQRTCQLKGGSGSS